MSILYHFCVQIAKLILVLAKRVINHNYCHLKVVHNLTVISMAILSWTCTCNSFWCQPLTNIGTFLGNYTCRWYFENSIMDKKFRIIYLLIAISIIIPGICMRNASVSLSLAVNSHKACSSHWRLYQYQHDPIGCHDWWVSYQLTECWSGSPKQGKAKRLRILWIICLIRMVEFANSTFILCMVNGSTWLCLWCGGKSHYVQKYHVSETQSR